MLIPMAQVAADGCDLSRVVHAGAHLAEEAADYDRHQSEVLWIEGDPSTFRRLADIVDRWPGQSAVCALLGPEPGEMVFHRASNDGMSSSVLELGTHAMSSPEVQFTGDVLLPVRTLDDVCSQHGFLDASGVQLDLQGFELAVLRGAPRLLGSVGWVYAEVNTQPVYEGCGLLWEVDDLLRAAGFEARRVVLAGDQRRGGRRWHGWGDGLWVRTGTDPRPVDETVRGAKSWHARG